MQRHGMHAIGLLVILTQLSTAQDTVKEIKRVVEQTAAAAARTVVEQLPASEPTSCVELDVLIACVVFDQKGELRVEKEGAEPELNRAGTIGVNLAAKLNEKEETMPQGVSPGTAGCFLLLQALADENSLQSLSRLQLRLALDGEKARGHMGYRRPRITGVTARGETLTNSVEFENVGTLVEATAQSTESGKINLLLSIERSDLGPKEEGELVARSDNAEIRTPTISIMSVETELVATEGETIVVSDLVESWENVVKETFILVTPTLIKP